MSEEDRARPSRRSPRAELLSRRSIGWLAAAGAMSTPLVVSCTPDQAAELLTGKGTITFSNDCSATQTKSRFTVPGETVNMKVNLPSKIGDQEVLEVVSLKRNDALQLLDKWRTEVSPGWSSYCKPLPLLELLMKVAFQSIMGGGTVTGLKKGSITLQIEAYTGATLRAQGTVTIDWEL
jgi:hypothetical protein